MNHFEMNFEYRKNLQTTFSDENAIRMIIFDLLKNCFSVFPFLDSTWFLFMQRLHRYGTVAFTLCLLASIFHLIALSYNTWLTAACNKCSDTDFFKYWTVSIGQRCYQIQMSQIFNGAQNASNSGKSRKLLRTEFCLPKRHLHARQSSYINTCLEAIEQAPHLVCSLRQYDPKKCQCE